MIFAPAYLAERQILMVGGEEASDFLSRLITSNPATDPAGPASYGALLSPQGKMLCDLFVFATPEGLALDYPAPVQAMLLRTLTLYRLRAKVTFTLRPDLGIHVYPDETRPDPRCAGFGSRTLGPVSHHGEPLSWHRARIGMGLADWSQDMEGLDMFPHEANLDQLHGISFTKGCYVGQEVVSRMEHRATARTRIVPVRFVGEAPAHGSRAMAGETVLGTVLSRSGSDALALLRLDRLGAALAAGVRPVADGAPFQVALPPWWRTGVPGGAI